MTTDLETMIDMLTADWPERVDWAERITDCEPACNGRKSLLDLAELRHYECACPFRIAYRSSMVMHSPLLTQLMESKWSVPVTGNNGRGGTKIEAPLPGNLTGPESVIQMIESAAWTICADWELDITPREGLDKHLTAISEDLHVGSATDLADAAGMLGPALRAALVYLGYRTGRVYLAEMVCPECCGALSVPRDLRGGSDDLVSVNCEGSPENAPCGRTWTPDQWVILHEVNRYIEEAKEILAVSKSVRGDKQTHCPANHSYAEHGRITKQGSRQCRACDRDRKAGRKPAEAREKTRTTPRSTRNAVHRALGKGAAVVDRVEMAQVYVRDQGVCHICRELVLPPSGFRGDEATMDHVKPLSAGGEHSYANVKLAHRACNSWKGADELLT